MEWNIRRERKLGESESVRERREWWERRPEMSGSESGGKWDCGEEEDEGRRMVGERERGEWKWRRREMATGHDDTEHRWTRRRTMGKEGVWRVRVSEWEDWILSGQ